MVPQTKTITVLGATGTQGSSVVAAFARPENNSPTTWNIRGVTRNPDSSKAQALKAQFPSIELIRADLNNVSSLKVAFKGSNVIFAVTDFWAPFADSEIRKKHSKGPNSGDSLRRFAYDVELKQGCNIAEAAATVLKDDPNKLERFVWSALPSCRENSKGKYKGIYHFDSKAAVTQMIKEQHADLASKMSVLYVSFYASNTYKTPLMRPIKLSDNTYVLERLCPGSAKHPFIITQQDTGRFVHALVDRPSSIGRTLLAYTAMLSWSDIAGLVSKATGKIVQFKEVTVEEFEKRHPMEGQEVLSARYSAEFGFAGIEDVLKPEDVGIKTEDGANRIEKWFAEQDWRKLL